MFYSQEKDNNDLPHLSVDMEDLRNETMEENANKDLVYSLNDRPPWYLCILLGFQVHHMSHELSLSFTLLSDGVAQRHCGLTGLVTGALLQISTFQGSLAKRNAQVPKRKGAK